MSSLKKGNPQSGNQKSRKRRKGPKRRKKGWKRRRLQRTLALRSKRGLTRPRMPHRLRVRLILKPQPAVANWYQRKEKPHQRRCECQTLASTTRGPPWPWPRCRCCAWCACGAWYTGGAASVVPCWWRHSPRPRRLAACVRASDRVVQATFVKSRCSVGGSGASRFRRRRLTRARHTGSLY